MILYKVEKMLRGVADVVAWELRGRAIPPPHFVKSRTILEFARRFGTRTLIETGTYRGYMIWSVLDEFDRLISIEVQKDLFEQARSRFHRISKVEILHGDSGRVLPDVLRTTGEPALFWLDGHWSGGVTGVGEKETPVLEELRAILAHPIKQHVILIDDARCFGTMKAYPQLDELEALVEQNGSGNYVMAAPQDDIIRICPKR